MIFRECVYGRTLTTVFCLGGRFLIRLELIEIRQLTKRWVISVCQENLFYIYDEGC